MDVWKRLYIGIAADGVVDVDRQGRTHYVCFPPQATAVVSEVTTDRNDFIHLFAFAYKDFSCCTNEL